MKFIVDGVEYADYNEALKAEENIKNKVTAICDNLKVFTVSIRDEIVLPLAIVTKDNHVEYAKAIAAEQLGVQFHINAKRQLVKNYVISECVNKRTVLEIAESIAKNGRLDKDIYYFNNLDIECEKESSKERPLHNTDDVKTVEDLEELIQLIATNLLN